MNTIICELNSTELQVLILVFLLLERKWRRICDMSHYSTHCRIDRSLVAGGSILGTVSSRLFDRTLYNRGYPGVPVHIAHLVKVKYRLLEVVSVSHV